MTEKELAEICNKCPVMEHLTKIRKLVDEQANDDGLWGVKLDGTLPITEAYLQQELRRLHMAIEDKTIIECVAELLLRT